MACEDSDLCPDKLCQVKYLSSCMALAVQTAPHRWEHITEA